MSESEPLATSEQTEIGSYFVATYPPFSVWNAESGAVWLDRLRSQWPETLWINPLPERQWSYTQSIGMIREIIQSVTIPVMAKARIGHFVEAQILEAIGVECSRQVYGGSDESGRQFVSLFIRHPESVSETRMRMMQNAQL